MEAKNLELVGYGFQVNADQERADFKFTTKPEHKKVLGVFLATEEDTLLNDCYIQLYIDNTNVVSYNEIQASLIQKTQYLSIEDVVWKLDKNVNDSTLRLTVINKSGKQIKGNLYLIAQRDA